MATAYPTHLTLACPQLGARACGNSSRPQASMATAYPKHLTLACPRQP